MRDGVDLSLEGPYELNRDDVREPLLLKPFDELLQVKPAVGNNPQNPDAAPDTPVGIGKEGKDVVSGGHVAGTIPQVDDVFAPSCFPYRRSTVESKVSQSSRIVFQGMSCARYAHTLQESTSTVLRLLSLLNIRVRVVVVSNNICTPNKLARHPCCQDT